MNEFNVLYFECFSFHQRTPLDVAVERGYVDIAECFLGGITEEKAGNFDCWHIV